MVAAAVSLFDAVAAELPFLRQQAESRMLDTWAIGTLSTEYDPDADGGQGAEVRTVTPLFTTPGRLTDRGTTVARDTQVGERTAIETTRELHIPWDSPAAPANAVAECTAVHATSDPTLLGTIVRLAGPSPASQKTARRLEVIEVLT
jgi:hypothetical protein